MILNTLYFILSFVTIWYGAGLIIQSIDRIARRLKVSSFAISFFLLGLLTSIPETAIGITAMADHNPEIFVGTLLGGTIVIFLFIIPLLAILGKGIRINHDLNPANTILALITIAAPGLLVIDHELTSLEGLLLIVSYTFLFYLIQKRHGLIDHETTNIMSLKTYSFLDLAKVGLGVSLVFISSQFIVNQTIIYSQVFDIPAFYISLLVLSIGTNLPELSLAIRAILSGKKDIAFGDYLGSAAANTLLFGIFTLLNEGEILTVNNFLITFIFIASGLALFYYFSKSKHDISRREGVVLMGVYLVFILYELGKGFFHQ